MKIGDRVQDFTLQDTKGDEHNLFDHLQSGKTLILFFPLAFSSVCTDEMCYFRDNKKLYMSLKTNILGISIDSFFVLREFKKVNNLPFPLLSDFNKKVSAQFEVLYEDYFGMKGVAKRAAFIVNEEKIVEYTEVLKDSGSLPNFRAIQESLAK